MYRIIPHIERLLAVHDCVIIPALGGFVLQTLSANYNKEQHAFSPMRKEVSFNAALQHADGLLHASYRQAYQVGYRQAQAMVETDVQEIKHILQKLGKIELGSLGSLATGQDGQLVYHLGMTHVFDAYNYGLTTFHFPLLPPAEADVLNSVRKRRKADTLYVPVSRALLQGSIAAAAAVALFLLASVPVTDVNQGAYTAGFIPTALTGLATSITPVTNETPSLFQSEVATTAHRPEDTSVTMVSAFVPDASAVTDVLPQKMYYTIIGSFPTEELANLFIAEVNPDDLPYVHTILRDGKHRVYAGAYSSRPEAEESLALLRTNEKYQTAWLFISR